jgi:hypothetical protein
LADERHAASAVEAWEDVRVRDGLKGQRIAGVLAGEICAFIATLDAFEAGFDVVGMAE